VAAAETLGRVGSAATRQAARRAIAEIQSRLHGALPGQLSLAGEEAGQLSLASDPAGQLSLGEDESGTRS
jgi:hypothetical protein